MTGTFQAAMSWWSRRYLGQEKGSLWPPAIAVSAFIWLEMVATETELPLLGLLGAATLSAVVAFILACWSARHVQQLRGNTVWAGVTILALMVGVAWILSTEPASHGYAWTDTLFLVAALFIAGTRVSPALPNTQQTLWRLGSGGLMVSLFVAALAIKGVMEDRGSPKPQDGFNVLLITIDTLRADHLGSYGHPYVKTPHMDRLAREGILFENAISPLPLTNPSHTTILTGMYPGNHGVTLNDPIPLRGDFLTLPELLRDGGYKTAAFVSSRILGKRLSTLHERFQLYEDDLGQLYPFPELVLRNSLTRLFFRGMGITASSGSRIAEQTASASQEESVPILVGN